MGTSADLEEKGSIDGQGGQDHHLVRGDALSIGRGMAELEYPLTIELDDAATHYRTGPPPEIGRGFALGI